MYLQGMDKKNKNIIFSMDFMGKNRKDYGEGIIQSIDEKNGWLICTKEGIRYIFTINCNSGEEQVVSKTGRYIVCEEGVIYYEDSGNGKMKLKRANTDNTHKKIVIKTKLESHDETYNYANIVDLQIKGDYIYFLYGGYDGSANMFQGGRISRVKKDGSAFQVLEFTVDPEFYLLDKDGKGYLIFNKYHGSDTIMAQSLYDFKTHSIDFEIHKKGDPFRDGTMISAYLSNTGKKTVLVSEEDYKEIGMKLEPPSDGNKSYLDINKVENVGCWTYYTAEVNRHNDGIDIGWRYGYDRENTYVYRKNRITSNKELLFSY